MKNKTNDTATTTTRKEKKKKKEEEAEQETKVITELNQAPITGRGKKKKLVMADITQFFHVTVSVTSFT